jgi:hypothetical protein
MGMEEEWKRIGCPVGKIKVYVLVEEHMVYLLA